MAGAAGRSWLWAQGLACGVLAATAAPLAAVLAVLFAPALLAALAAPREAPREAPHRLGGLMLAYGLAAALPWLGALWTAARDWAMALDLLAGMRIVGLCWGAQAAAWLLCEIAPLLARLVTEARVRARESRLREARRRLREEWGLGETE